MESLNQQEHLNITQFINYEQFDAKEELDKDILDSNNEIIQQEIETLQSILNEQEVQELQVDNILRKNEDLRKNSNMIEKILKLSLIPSCKKKFVLIDIPKDIRVVLRCLPQLDIYVVLTNQYPSNQCPLFYLSSQFYQPFQQLLYEKINDKWQPDTMIIYEIAYFIQEEFINTYFEEGNASNLQITDKDEVQISYQSSSEFQQIFDLSQRAQRRTFNNEEHKCEVCMRNLLGDKFFFLSGCQHYFCLECIQQQVMQKINDAQVSKIFCPDSKCRKNLNDLDIQNMGLDKIYLNKYEQFSLTNAIAQMDDLGWCPLPGCQSLATIEKEHNYGKCTHCDYMFCLDCRERYHPYKRCLINRLDIYDLITQEDKDQMNERNKRAEKLLNEIFFKHCSKYCPNNKCGIKIQKIKSGCTHMQCPRCYHWFCWVCLHDAKGQKHFKEKPDCKIEEGSLQPEFITYEIKQKYLQMSNDYVNLKFCAKCPNCEAINEKKDNCNLFTCHRCQRNFCYICNKPINGPEHYNGQALCHYESDLYSDF